jgi:amidase
VVDGGAIEEATLGGLAAGLASGALTSRSIVDACLERVERLDRAGPTLRTVIQIAPDLDAEVAAADAARRDGRARGSLHGVPILVKDNLDTAGALRTTAGSLALTAARPRRDAHVVRKLREAGAIVMAKTNLSEWANIRSTRSSSGWSAVGGQCRNPHVLDRSPCGSSSGSGAAVAAGLGPAAIGTETDGSIVCPSAICGIVGIKPTVGLVSQAGIVPISHTQDTAGPMARSVSDAATVLAAIADRELTWTEDPAALRGTRIGVARNLAGFHDGVEARFDEALDALRELGAELIDPADVRHADELEAPEYEVLLYEFKADLEAYLGALGGEAPRSLAEVIAFNQANARAELAHFGQELFERAAEKGPLTDAAYVEALATCRRLSREEGLDAVIAEHRLDAIVAPTNGPAWLIDHVNGDHYGGGNSSVAAVAGYPSVTVPMGFVHDLPVGLSFIAGPWHDGILIGYATSFERATRWGSAPRFLASLSQD